MKVKRSLLLIGFLLTFAFILNACGGSGASTDLTVELTDFSFTPNTFTVPAGEEITLALSNEGAVEHEFVIMKLGTQATSPFDDDDEPNVYWEVELDSGKSETVTFTAPAEPGEYQLVCGTQGHLEAGMIGTLTVVK
jgi:uncharacterized cupredoxin-like copper-binding protein